MKEERIKTDNSSRPGSIQSADLPIGKRPLVMGVLNVTPDSFSDGGKFYDVDTAVQHASRMALQGADIIDIGGESTRPGAREIDAEEEIRRVKPVLERLSGKLKIPFSIDTRKSPVAMMACEYGAKIINDVSALTYDGNIARVAKEYDAYLILMHMRGTPETMQTGIHYDNLVDDISDYLMRAVEKALKAGIARQKLIIDPGIGFGKTVNQNFSLLKNIPVFRRLGFPIMVGASRKSFIGKTLNLAEEERLEGSLAAAIYAVLNGADIIRVHDVLPTVRAMKIIDRIRKAD